MKIVYFLIWNDKLKGTIDKKFEKATTENYILDDVMAEENV